tara:strand:- start:65 stop:301 length:237 start_codon:yes stop_codon:yes gene_type:complete
MFFKEIRKDKDFFQIKFLKNNKFFLIKFFYNYKSDTIQQILEELKDINIIFENQINFESCFKQIVNMIRITCIELLHI